MVFGCRLWMFYETLSDKNGEFDFDEDLQSFVQAVAAQLFNEDRKIRTLYWGEGSSRMIQPYLRSQSMANDGKSFTKFFTKGSKYSKSTNQPRSSNCKEGPPFSPSTLRHPENKQCRVAQMWEEGKGKVREMWIKIGRFFLC